MKLQGKEGNILDLRAIITGLGNKLKVWGNAILNGNFSVFSNLNKQNKKQNK